jgi:hypothetical protein
MNKKTLLVDCPLKIQREVTTAKVSTGYGIHISTHIHIYPHISLEEDSEIASSLNMHAQNLKCFGKAV